MVNLINYRRLWLLIFFGYLAGISTLPARGRNVVTVFKQNKTQHNYRRPYVKTHNTSSEDDKIVDNTADLLAVATDYQHAQLNLPVTLKPRGFNLPKSRSGQQKSSPSHESASQNYYSNYFPAQPFYSLNEDSIIAKFLSQQAKQFQPRHQPFAAPDASILGSGDFGILRGGTFYSDEEQSYINEEGTDIYYGSASNTHDVSSTEGFIQKYTYPEEQFAQFRDFADLGTPSDSAFSQYVVVYAAKNATGDRPNSKPKNIFEQLQEIDKEKALEQKRMKKNQTNPSASITKLKLVKTKLMEKKWVQKQPIKVMDDDPLLALS